MINSKKGGVADIFVAVILSFFVVLIFVVFTFMSGKVNDKFLEVAPTIQAQIGTGDNVTLIVNDTIGKIDVAFQSFKWMSTFLIAGFFISILVSAFLVRTHPAWFFGYVLILIIAVVFSVYISNIYEDLLLRNILEGTMYEFAGANFIFAYLPIWVTVIGFVAAILMFINLDWGTN